MPARRPWIEPFCAFFIIGYLLYDCIHYATHHVPMKLPSLHFLNIHHLRHPAPSGCATASDHCCGTGCSAPTQPTRAHVAAEFTRAPEASAAVRTARSSVDRVVLRTLARAFTSLLAAFALASPAGGAPERTGTDDVRGLWVDQRESDKRKVAVWIEDCDGLLCGRIYWLKKPLSASGHPKRDQLNPDVALRDRPLCGLTILSGFRRVKENTWSAGQIYNANDGRTFSSTITLENDGSLRIRGYVGISLFGKTVEWVRPQENLERCG